MNTHQNSNYSLSGTSTPGFPENSPNTPPLSSIPYVNSSPNINQVNQVSIEYPSPLYSPPAMTGTSDFLNQRGQIFYSFKGVTSRLCEIDSRITKYNDFLSLCYGMFIWSLLCFLLSIWYITTRNREDDITIDEEGVHYRVEYYRYNWYTILCFFVNLIHCAGYFYAIRTYNHQSSKQMHNTYLIMMGLALSNFAFFFIYMLLIKEGFFTFCVDLLFLIFNVLLCFQSKELMKLFEEKESVKIMYQ